MSRTLASFSVLALLGILAGCGGSPRLQVPTPTEENYISLRPTAIHAVSSQEVFVVGGLERRDGAIEGLILMTETGGRRWRRVATEVHELGRASFQAVHFNDRLRGWVAGIRVDQEGRGRALILRTEDGGNHWWEAALAQDPSVTINEVHSLYFTSDLEGTVAVRSVVGGKEIESRFMTVDAGRTWVVGSYQEAASAPFNDRTQTFVDAYKGFRLVGSPYPGVTFVESSASGGQDWMPVSELSLNSLNTYY